MGPNPSDQKRKNIPTDWGKTKGPFLIFLGALYFYYVAGKMEDIPGQLGPAFWPRVILILLMISCGIKFLEIFLFPSQDLKPGGEERPPAVNIFKLAALIALVAGAVLAMDKIGFLLTNFLFLTLFMHATGVRKKSLLFLSSGLGTILLLYLFVKVVYLPLPKGRWFFDEITLFFYRLLHII